MNNFFYFLYTNVGIDMTSPGMPQTFTKAYIGSLGFIMLVVTLIVALLYYIPPKFSNFFARFVNRKSWIIITVLAALLNSIITLLNCQNLVGKRPPNMVTPTMKMAVYIFSIDTFIFTIIFLFLFSLVLRYNNAHTRYIPF